MKKFLKIVKNKIGNGITLLVVPSNGAAVKSFRVSFAALIMLIVVVITNLYLIWGYAAQVKRNQQCKKILNQKNLQISVLQQEQKRIKPTLDKSYQIADELNQLKQQRLLILNSWKAIQKDTSVKQHVSRGLKYNRERDYQLPSYNEGQTAATINSLDTNLEQIQNFIKTEQLKQQTLLTDITNYQKKLKYIPSLNPLRYSRITSWFGVRIHPKLGFSRMHSGIDLGASIGTKVYATAEGKVSFAGYKNGYGNTVILDHGYGYQTIYGHNSKLLVKTGDKIKKGQVISLSGNTGTSTGPHLHYEVRVNGQPVNPILFLKN